MSSNKTFCKKEKKENYLPQYLMFRGWWWGGEGGVPLPPLLLDYQCPGCLLHVILVVSFSSTLPLCFPSHL